MSSNFRYFCLKNKSIQPFAILFRTIQFPDNIKASITSEIQALELKGYSFITNNGNDAKAVRLGLFQNSIIKPTTDPINEQRSGLLDLGKEVISLAAQSGVQIFCFQELWSDYAIYTLILNNTIYFVVCIKS